MLFNNRPERGSQNSSCARIAKAATGRIIALSRDDAVGQASRLSLTSQLRLAAFGFLLRRASLNGEGRCLVMETGATAVLRVAARRHSKWWALFDYMDST